MAIHRESEYCPNCNQPLEAIHKDMGKGFVGDTFIAYKPCKCLVESAYPITMSPPMSGQNESIEFLEWYELTNYWHDDTVIEGPMMFKNGFQDNRKYTSIELYNHFLISKNKKK